ncbi:hypothetical protein VTK26DRAFT_5104 [Humicola hyalothermophila]
MRSKIKITTGRPKKREPRTTCQQDSGCKRNGTKDGDSQDSGNGERQACTPRLVQTGASLAVSLLREQPLAPRLCKSVPGTQGLESMLLAPPWRPCLRELVFFCLYLYYVHQCPPDGTNGIPPHWETRNLGEKQQLLQVLTNLQLGSDLTNCSGRNTLHCHFALRGRLAIGHADHSWPCGSGPRCGTHQAMEWCSATGLYDDDTDVIRRGWLPLPWQCPFDTSLPTAFPVPWLVRSFAWTADEWCGEGEPPTVRAGRGQLEFVWEPRSWQLVGLELSLCRDLSSLAFWISGAHVRGLHVGLCHTECRFSKPFGRSDSYYALGQENVVNRLLQNRSM